MRSDEVFSYEDFLDSTGCCTEKHKRLLKMKYFHKTKQPCAKITMYKQKGGYFQMAKKVKEYKINPDRVEEALLIQNRMLIELFVQVLDEQLVIERPVLHERLENLIELSDNDRDLKDTLHALTQKL